MRRRKMSAFLSQLMEQYTLLEKQKNKLIEQWLGDEADSAKRRKAEQLIDRYMMQLARILSSRDERKIDVVLIGTTVHIEEEGGAVKRMTLCFPHEADASKGYVSFLSPIGTGLLLSRQGSVMKSGERNVRIIDLQSSQSTKVFEKVKG